MRAAILVQNGRSIGQIDRIAIVVVVGNALMRIISRRLRRRVRMVASVLMSCTMFVPTTRPVVVMIVMGKVNVRMVVFGNV